MTCLHLEVGLHLDADLEVLATLLIEGGVQTARVADLPAQGHVVRLVPDQDAEDADVAARYLRRRLVDVERWRREWLIMPTMIYMEEENFGPSLSHSLTIPMPKYSVRRQVVEKVL